MWCSTQVIKPLFLNSKLFFVMLGWVGIPQTCALPAVSIGLCPKGHWRETAKLGDREGMVPSVSGIGWQLYFISSHGFQHQLVPLSRLFIVLLEPAHHPLLSSVRLSSHASEAAHPSRVWVSAPSSGVWVSAPWGPFSELRGSNNSDFFPLLPQSQGRYLLLAVTVFVSCQCSPLAFPTLWHLLYETRILNFSC